VAAVAPLAFGDVVRGYAIVGTTAAFVARWGRLRPVEGNIFGREGEAVIGAAVDLRLGEEVTPSHAPIGADERAHRHAGVKYKIVGRLPRLGTPWDRAILVPIESVWETHGLGDGHAAENAPIGPPFDAIPVPPLPVIVVKPRSVADAYALRSQHRTGGSMALFPAEALVAAYRALGDARDAMVIASALNNLLVFVAIVLLLVTLAGLRRRRHALLRALGASRWHVLFVIWLSGAVLMIAGCAAGLMLGWVGAVAVARLIEARTGLFLPAELDTSDVLLVVGMAGVGSVLAAIPAFIACRGPPADGLRG
jgi:putative ABC transport system permease protein